MKFFYFFLNAVGLKYRGSAGILLNALLQFGGNDADELGGFFVFRQNPDI